MFWEWGYTDLPACGPWRGSTDGLVRPSFNINNSRPLQGAKPRKVDDTGTSRWGGLPRLAPEERRYLCKVHVVRFR